MLGENEEATVNQYIFIKKKTINIYKNTRGDMCVYYIDENFFCQRKKVVNWVSRGLPKSGQISKLYERL